MPTIQELRVQHGEHVAYFYRSRGRERYHRVQYVATVNDPEAGHSHLITPPERRDAFWYAYNDQTGRVRAIGYEGEQRYGPIPTDGGDEIVVQAIGRDFPNFVRAESLTERFRAQVDRVRRKF